MFLRRSQTNVALSSHSRHHILTIIMICLNLYVQFRNANSYSTLCCVLLNSCGYNLVVSHVAGISHAIVIFRFVCFLSEALMLLLRLLADDYIEKINFGGKYMKFRFSLSPPPSLSLPPFLSFPLYPCCLPHFNVKNQLPDSVCHRRKKHM